MLKPMLARGELRMVGATTLDEYRERIEKDPALERRFQQVLVAEPTVEDTVAILRGLKGRYEAHHKVQIADSALVAAASLSDRYITSRFLPDKAIDLVDEAASRLRMEIDSSPVEIDELQRAVDRLKMEELALRNETDSRLRPAAGEAAQGPRRQGGGAARSDRPLGEGEAEPQPRRCAQGEARRAARPGGAGPARRRLRHRLQAALRRDPGRGARAGGGGRRRGRAGGVQGVHGQGGGRAGRHRGCGRRLDRYPGRAASWRARPRSCCVWRRSSASG